MARLDMLLHYQRAVKTQERTQLFGGEDLITSIKKSCACLLDPGQAKIHQTLREEKVSRTAQQGGVRAQETCTGEQPRGAHVGEEVDTQKGEKVGTQGAQVAAEGNFPKLPLGGNVREEKRNLDSRDGANRGHGKKAKGDPMGISGGLFPHRAQIWRSGRK